MTRMGWIGRVGTALGRVAAAALCATAAAADFRIESKVFIDKQPVPRSENTTLFHNGIVYDYGKNPYEVTILDPAEGRSRIVLMSPRTKMKTEIKLADIETFVVGLKKAAAEAPAPFMQFLAAPTFKETFDPASRELVLDSEYMEYKLTTVAASTPEVAAEYRRFSDWYAKLNALTNVAAIPPFARMHVNSRLGDGKSLPVNVQLTLKQVGPNGRDLILKSEHKIAWRLYAEDQQRILQTDDMFVKYKTVDAKTYFQAAQPPEDPAVAEKPEEAKTR